MKRRICDICNHDKFFEIGQQYQQSIVSNKTKMKFDVRLVCCKNCGLVLQNPIQDEAQLTKYYNSMFREENSRPIENIEKEIKHRIEFICKYRKPDQKQSILEIGCSNGSTLVNLYKSGFSVCGIEPSIENSNTCKKRGLSVFNGIYSEFDSKNKKFDFILSYYVLEHLTSPTHFMKFCNNLLSENGIICIEIPDINSYKNEKTITDLLFFFEHQYHFTKDTLQILLKKCGFELLEFSSNTTHNFGMHFSAKKISKPQDKLFEIPQNIFENVMKNITDYRKYHTERLENLRKKLKIIFTENRENNGKIILCPASKGSKTLLELPEVDLSSIECIIDNNPEKIGNSFFGFQIYSLKDFNFNFDFNKILIRSSFNSELKNQLLSLGIDENKILVMD